MELKRETLNEHGFTMVEMMVVVLIIGILAAIAIPLYMEQRKSAYEAVVQSDLNNVGTQIAATQNKTTGGFKTPVLEGSSSIDRKTSKAVHVSPGVSLSFYADKDAFCLVGSHAANPSNVWAYSYQDGGVVKNASSCSGLPQVGGLISAGNPSGPIAAPTTTSPTTSPTTDPSASPSPTTTEKPRTGDIYQDDPIDGGLCSEGMLAINRSFNEAVNYRTPQSMMLLAAYDLGWGSTYLDQYYAHADTVQKFHMYDVEKAAQDQRDVDPDLQAEYDWRNQAMWDGSYGYMERDAELSKYQTAIRNYLSGQGTKTIPTTVPAEVQAAYEAHTHYFHQWNYIQCSEYAYPAHPMHKVSW